MRARIIEVWDNLQMINCMQDTKHEVIEIIEIDSREFERIINCNKETRKILIDNILNNKIIDNI